MTEQEWDACTDPVAMLWFLRDKASDRKLRLLASAYCRSVWHLLSKASRKAVTLGEHMADEAVTESERDSVVRAAIQAVCRFEEGKGDYFMAADMAYRVACNDGWYAAEWSLGNWPPLPSGLPILEGVCKNIPIGS
jgi:hypothetical protein